MDELDADAVEGGPDDAATFDAFLVDDGATDGAIEDSGQDSGQDSGGADASRDASGPDGCVSGDRDGDGFCDAVDRCPDTPDDQTDTDGDGIGDACECERVVCEPIDECHGAGVCQPETGLCTRPVLADGTLCDDGTACTMTDACTAGACVGGDPVVCVASDDCHSAGVCVRATGVCTHPVRPDGATCSDGDACTSADTCAAGVCTSGARRVCLASDACHVAGTCDAGTGLCSDPPAMDGAACDDGDLCTTTDACAAGTCAGSDPVVCVASDTCHVAGTCDSGTGACSDPPAMDGTACDDADSCTSGDACAAGACAGSPISGCGDVIVSARDALAFPITPGRIRAYAGGAWVHRSVSLDASGDARFVGLARGTSHRFLLVRDDGDFAWSSASDHCDPEACSNVTLSAPTPPVYASATWDPTPFVLYGAGEILAPNASFTANGVYVESWAVDGYATPMAMLAAAHDHVGDACAALPGRCDNAGRGEDQHAFGTTLEGIFVRPAGGGRFALEQLDYRVRDDTAIDHVQSIPGVDPTRVEIWIAAFSGDHADLATATFASFVIGPRAELPDFETLFPSGFDDVSGVYITSTWNVSLDNVVLRPLP